MVHMGMCMVLVLTEVKTEVPDSCVAAFETNNTCCVGLVPLMYMTVSIYIRPAPCRTQELAP
jgi:hypothetical protein